MIRELISNILTSDAHAQVIVASAGPHSRADEMLNLWGLGFSTIIAAIFTATLLFPKGHMIRMMLPPAFGASFELIEYGACCSIGMFALVRHMSLNANYTLLMNQFIHLGAIVGCVFYGAIGKCSRKGSLFLCQIFGSGMLVVLFIFVGGLKLYDIPIEDRDYIISGALGNRKVRPLLDAYLLKAITNELGYGGIPLDFQRYCLLNVFLGFAISVLAVGQAMVCDVASSERVARRAMFVLGIAYWWFGGFWGTLMGYLFYSYFDMDYAFIAMIVFKGIRFLYLIVATYETKGYDRGWGSSTTFCFNKFIYYGTYLWPQGMGYEHLSNAIVYMLFDRAHLSSSTAGYLAVVKTRGGRILNCYLMELMACTLHMPTVGVMFIVCFFTGSPLYASLAMDMYHVYNYVAGFDMTFFWISLYPAFITCYCLPTDLTIYLSVADAMRHLGSWLAIVTWPNQLMCGDPMNCWRSQYLYSHAIFYNIGGNGGNIQYVNWYIFAKSQRRQCCCPYRKLKPDAPEKCCNPCCLGPLVEESGGCPCPCCCASCSA